jgi:DNA-binding transcriptional LysR family regulator
MASRAALRRSGSSSGPATPAARVARSHLPADLRLGDLITFFAVQRCGSLTGAARELVVTASQVSKAISRLEQQLNVVLLRRSVRGVTLTDEAMRILPHLEQVMGHFRRMVQVDDEPRRRLTVAAPSYLLSIFLPVIAESQPQVRLCGLELPPAMLRAHAAENLFDLSIIPGRMRLPPTWQSVPVGEIRLALLARPALARRLGPTPVDPERLLMIPFITPAYSVSVQAVPVDDDCPLSLVERRQGHQVQTLNVALELAMHTDQLVFGPVIAARRAIDEGRLVEVEVKGWRCAEPLHIACNTQQLLAAEHDSIVRAIERALAALTRR